MTQKERYTQILNWFAQNRPEANTELHYGNPFELLVAVMLSAQCTDRRVNKVMPHLLQAFPTAAAMAAAKPEEIFPYIRSVSYPNSKAGHLAGMARKLMSEFDGKVPEDTDALQTLPGVGRKTANVVAAVAFGQAKMAVDTHVFRVAERLGLTTNSKNPLQTERTLTAHIPKAQLSRAHHWLILHGRYTCTARAPKCTTCGLTAWCRQFNKTKQTKLVATTPPKSLTKTRGNYS